MPTLTGWEKRIKAYSEANMLCLSKGKVQRIARRIDRRQREYTDEQLRADAYCLTYDDPTGEDAIRNVLIEMHLIEESA